jgi:hypothetical protein
VYGVCVNVTSKTDEAGIVRVNQTLEKNMSTPSPAASNLAKTEECKTISYHFSMGIGRLRQIAAKVVNPNSIEAFDASTTNIDSGSAVVVTTAKSRSLRHQKQLIESPELDEIRSQDSKLRSFIEKMSAAAGHESTRFVLSSEVERIWRMMEGYRTIRRPQLVAAFMAEYRKLEALNFEPLKEALGDQFDRGDYRPSDEVEAGFSFTYTVRNVGTVELTGLPSHIIDEEIAKERKQRAEAVEEFKGVLRFTLKKLIDTLFAAVKPQMDGKKRKFYDSSVENLLEFINNFEKQDMANDTETQVLIKSLKQVLSGVTPDMVRESDNLKVHIASKLDELSKEAFKLVQVTGRKFR